MSLPAVMVPGFYTRYISLGMQTGDSSPPVETSAFTAGAVGATFAGIGGVATDLNGPIRLFMVALADAAAAPSEAQIIAGTDAADAAAPKSSASAASGAFLSSTIAGLSNSTAYDIYYTLVDAFDNAATAAKIDVTTTAASAYDPNETVRPIASGARMVRSVVNDVI
jgi:hypothetical protein